MAVKPISPQEVLTLPKPIPDFVIEIVNAIIIDRWNKCGGSGKNVEFTIIQNYIVDRIEENQKNNSNFKRSDIFENGWLNFEDHYRKEGWKVSFIKPAYYDYTPNYFIFSSP